MAWGRLLVVCTPHLVHTFCGENTELAHTGATEMSPPPRVTPAVPGYGNGHPESAVPPGWGWFVGPRGGGGGLTFLQSSQTTQAEPLAPSCSPQRMQRFTPSPSTLRRMSSSRVIRRLGRGHRECQERRRECQEKRRIPGQGPAARVPLFLFLVSLPLSSSGTKPHPSGK